MLGNNNNYSSSDDCNYSGVEIFWKPTLALNLLDMYKPYLHEPNETLHDYAGKYSSIDAGDLILCFEEITLLMLLR